MEVYEEGYYFSGIQVHLFFQKLYPVGECPSHPFHSPLRALSLDENLKGQKSLTLSFAITVRQEGCMGKKSKREGETQEGKGLGSC